MKVLEIIQEIANASAGPSYSVGRLTEELAKRGDDASILTLGVRPSRWPYASRYWIDDGFVARRLGFSPSLIRRIREYSNQPCILHGHGLWRQSNLFPLFMARRGRSSAKSLLSPRGMLTPWSLAHKKRIKRLYWNAGQRSALQACDCLHATAESEYDDIRRAGLNNPVTTIPNGIDIPDLKSDAPRAKRIVFLSRIDPKKGLDLLLPAWRAIAEDHPAWELVIAGPLVTKYSKTIQSLAKKLAAPRVHFAGQVLADEKHDLLAGASLFVLPTYSENFGIVVAEALAHGVPVITTTETPWSGLERRGCGWVIPPRQDELEESLRKALSLPLQELNAMGSVGRRWMQDEFSWARVAEQMQVTYLWLFGEAARPDWVHD